MKATKNIIILSKDTPFITGLRQLLIGLDNCQIFIKSNLDKKLVKNVNQIVLLDLDCYSAKETKEFVNFYDNIIALKGYKNIPIPKIPFVNKRELNDLTVKKLYDKIESGMLTVSPFQDYSHLSTREQEVLLQVCNGLKSTDIADICDISIGSINAYRLSIQKKIGAKNSAHAVYLALQYCKKNSDITESVIL